MKKTDPSATNQGPGPGLQWSRHERGLGELWVETEARQGEALLSLTTFPFSQQPCPTSAKGHNIPDCPVFQLCPNSSSSVMPEVQLTTTSDKVYFRNSTRYAPKCQSYIEAQQGLNI